MNWRESQLKMPGTYLFQVLAIFFMLFVYSLHAVAAENRTEQLPAKPAEAASTMASVPDLAEIVPMEIKLAGRLQELEKQLQFGLDSVGLDKSYTELEADVDGLSKQLDILKNSQEYKYNKLVDLREYLNQKSETFLLVNKPLSSSIRRLSELRKKWQAEESRWNEWQTALLQEGELEQLRDTFNDANVVIKTALDSILSELDVMLAVQERSGGIERSLDNLIGEVDTQIAEERRNTLFNDTPPMFSELYLNQLKNGNLWEEFTTGLNEIYFPARGTVLQHGWIALLQAFISFVFILFIYKKKSLFKDTERWSFLALYPYASGLFLGYITCALLYEYQGAPSSWKLATAVLGGTAYARLMQGVVDEKWKALYIKGLVAVIIVTGFIDVVGLPIPIFRLYICCAALVGFLFCMSLAGGLKKEGKTGFYFWMLQADAYFLAMVVLVEMWGKKALASYLFVSLINSIGTTFIFILFMYIFRGGIEWLFNTPLLRRSATLSESEAGSIIIKLSRFINTLIVLLVIVPAIFMTWGIYPNLKEATAAVLDFGFMVGENHFTVGLLMISVSILYGAFLFSWIVQKLLVDEVLFNRRMEKGARISIARLVHYVILVIGFLAAVSAFGIEISKLTIVFSALGVGIGFGLKDIVNNFVSGLVLLFEQPIRVGDLIEIDGMWAEIKDIGIRSTIVKSFDHADLIIPNANLISNQVTNWTLGSRQARLIIPVGVAYGSDVDLVMETLVACAEDNPKVNPSPAPQALFLSFGESSLDFELRVFVGASMRIPIRSELHYEIDKRFRANNICIAFPQRDVHVSEIKIEKGTPSN